MSTFGESIQLREDVLPRELDIYNHFLHQSTVKYASGEWRQNTDISAKAKCVRDDVASIWDRTDILQGINTREGLRKIQTIIQKGKKLQKVAMERRGESFGMEFKLIFDAALCHHAQEEMCSCPNQNKVRYSQTVKVVY